MVDLNGDSEGFGSRVRACVRVRFFIRCKGSIGLWLELGAGSNVRGSMRLRSGYSKCG